MGNLAAIKRKLQLCIDQDIERNIGTKRVSREAYIKDGYENGGKGFVERVFKFGLSEKGNPIDDSIWYREYLEFLGDLRLNHVLTTGCAQVGKTLGNTLLLVDLVVNGKLNVGWFYDTRTNLDQNVPIMFQPIIRYWVARMEKQGYRFKTVPRKNINTRYQIDDATAIFSYVSTSRASHRQDGGAAAGGAVVAYQLDAAFLEERSQYQPGSADPIPRRLDASMLPTRPIRELGTPGGGAGIESEFAGTHHHFYPHYKCPHCGAVKPLDPKGCLLREFKRLNIMGKEITSFLSESGRPVKWLFSGDNAIETAYIGCSACEKPLSDEIRYAAQFQCLRTGVTLRNFLDSLPPGIPDTFWKVGIHLSPLTRRTERLAEKIIRGGLDSVMTNDWQQQMLGWPSESETSNISIPMLLVAMAAPKPQFGVEPDFKLAGIDVGRSEDWLAVIDYYLPENHATLSSIAEIMEKTVRVVRFGGGVMRSNIPSMLDDFYVEYGLIDNEPSRESSMMMCRHTCLELVNQVGGQKKPVQQSIVVDGGIEYPCWDIRREKFMATVLEGFVLVAADDHCLFRLPEDWKSWIGTPTERSPLKHLTGPWRDTENKWHRGKDNIDDLYMAFSFCEAAFYLMMTLDGQPKAGVGTYTA